MKSKTLVSYKIDFTSVFPFQNAFKKTKKTKPEMYMEEFYF